MEGAALPLADGEPRRFISRLVTEQVRVVLENRSVRFGAIGVMLVIASIFSLTPPSGVDPGWMFIVPVAVSAVAAGVREGVITALVASALCALYAVAKTGGFDIDIVVGVIAARFMLYGLTGAVLGAFAEAHHDVQSNLRLLASTDPLTRVANVARFYEELGMLEALSDDFAVLLIDVDDLKALNDRHGHQAGSTAIQTVANCLRRIVRGSDCVARFGGDEFVVILRGAGDAGAQVVVNRLREELATEINPYAPEVPVAVSIGVALYGRDGTTSEELLAAADSAMYEDKRGRKALRPASV